MGIAASDELINSIDSHSNLFQHIKEKTNYCDTSSTSSDLLPTEHKINADTGTTGNFIAVNDTALLLDVAPVTEGLIVELPNGERIVSTHTALLDFPTLPLAARRAHIFPSLTGSLLSIGLLTDAGLTATYTSQSLVVTDSEGHTVLSGTRSPINRLWMVDMERPCGRAPEQCASVIRHENDYELVLFYHAVLGSPATSTFIAAAERGYLDCLPNLSVDKIRKNKPKTVPQSKGHLDQARKNVRSTQPKPFFLPPALPSTDDFTDAFPVMDTVPANLVSTSVQLTHRSYMDSTGKFPVKSRSGCEYTLIMYDHDENYLHYEPMRPGKNRLLDAYKRGVAMFNACGRKPRFQRLDNETSADLVKFMRDENIEYQYVPPHCKRRNAAERGIRTAKNHLIAILCTADPDFPLNLWDAILPQTELTLNLMRGSRRNPKQSAWEALHGPYDFNAHPLAPIGTRIVMHEKPAQRGSWAPHGVDGFYIGPALEHYRCYRGWVTSTQRERIVDTVAWHPRNVMMPGASAQEILTNAVLDLQRTIRAATPDQHTTLGPTLTQLHDKVAELYPSSTPPTTEDASLRRLADHVRAADTTIMAPTPAASRPPVVQFSPTVTIIPDAPIHTDVGEQRVHETPAQEQRVEKTPPYLSVHNPTPGRPVLPVGGDNTTYAHPRAAHERLPAAVSHPARDFELPQPATHIKGWRVHSILKHRGKIAHRSKLQFQVTWHPLADGTTSPPTWIPWSVAKQLQLTSEYIQQIPLMRYLLPALTIQLPATMPHLANATTGVDGQPLKYKQLIRGPDAAAWIEERACEFDRLIDETQTMKFCYPEDKPDHRKASYSNPQCSLKPGNIRRVRETYGGDRSDYEGEVSASAASLDTVNIMLNATISELGARFTTADIKDYFLQSDLEEPEFMWIDVKDIPARTYIKYNVHLYERNGKVMVRIDKGIYGLPQAARLAKHGLDGHLNQHGYFETSTICLYKHVTRPVMFALVVDDFGIKSHGTEHTDHLLNTLRLRYQIKVGDGSKYLGIELEWDYEKRTVTKSMPKHLAQGLNRFGVILRKPHYSPGGYVAPVYGSRAQQMADVDDSPLLDAAGKTRIQQIAGTFLYYARVIDSTMLKKINEISSVQAHATEKVAKMADDFLQYAATYPITKVVYHASDMILHQQSDASYLGETKARSRAGGISFLGNKYEANTIPATPINGLLSPRSSILDVVVSSAAEAELGALFENARDATVLRSILDSFGYPQPATPIQTDNKCAHGIANDTVKAKRSKAFDMRYYWLKDRVKQKQFYIYWREGGHNLADYLTKDHPAAHHRKMRHFFVA